MAGRPGHATTIASPLTNVEHVAAAHSPLHPAEHEPVAGYPAAPEGETWHGSTAAFEREGGYDGPAGATFGEATMRLGEARRETAYPAEGEVTRDDLAPVPEFGTAGRPRRSRMRRASVLGIAVAVVVAGGGTAGAWALTSGPDRQQVAEPRPVPPPRPAPLTDAQRKAAAARRHKVLTVRASRAAKDDDSKPTLYAKGEPPVTKTPTPTPQQHNDPTPVGEAQRIARSMLSDFGWKPSEQFGCLVDLWNRESHWNTHAASPSGAYGIPQALPGSKMSSAGPDWQNNAHTQIKWGLGYIKDRYGTPCAAWQHSQATGWY